MSTPSRGASPLWTASIAAQISRSEVEQAVCAESVNLLQMLAMGLGLLSVYFFVKFLFRLVSGFGASSDQNGDQRYSIGTIVRSAYTFVAGLIPLLVLWAITVLGIDVVSCVVP